jgi:hypothetical protein
VNDLELIQDFRSEVRRSDPRALNAGRERLLAAMAPAPASRRLRPMALRLAGVGALGLSIVVGVTAVRGIDDAGSRRGTVGAPAWVPVANAEVLAERARASAARVEDVYPRADQWLYTKGLIYVSEQATTPDAGKTQTHERWRRGDGGKVAIRHSGVNADVAPIGSEGLVSATVGVAPNGGDGLVRATAGGSAETPQTPEWDVAYLRSLPLDPAALMERLRKDEENRPDRSNLPQARMLFQRVQMILQEGAPPPRLRAALYTVVSKLEGVGIEQKVQDLTGREGMGIYLDRGDGVRHEIIVDPASYAYLGGREVVVTSRSIKGQYAEGDVIVAWAQVSRGIVDHAGDLP